MSAEPGDPSNDPQVDILERRSIPLSKWVSVEEVVLRMPGSDRVETYHGLRQADAINILAMTNTGYFVLVRQFRPIVGAWTWEIPAGAVDAGEVAADAAIRELREETGYRVRHLVDLGSAFEDPPRRTNRIQSYFAIVEDEPEHHEAGTYPRLVNGPKLKELSLSGELALPSQVALLFRAGLNPHVRALLANVALAGPTWF